MDPGQLADQDPHFFDPILEMQFHHCIDWKSVQTTQKGTLCALIIVCALIMLNMVVLRSLI